MPDTIARKMREKEYEKVERILKRADKWAVEMIGIQFMVLTIPNPEEGKNRLIVGCVGIAEGNRICYLAVEPNHRNKGYGAKLLEAVKKKIKGDCYLRVKATNWTAIKLYWRHGFKITGAHDRRSWVMACKKDLAEVEIPGRKPIEAVEITTPSMLSKYMKSGGYRLSFKGNIPVMLKYGLIADTLPLNQKITGTLNSDIDLQGLSRYARYYVNQDIAKIIEGLDSEWSEWRPELGAWTKRFESYLYKTHKIKLDSTQLSALGNGLADYRPMEYNLEIGQKIDWKVGFFGDGNSCWVDGDYYGHAKAFFSSGRGFAVKLYKSNKFDAGMGRCWLYASEDHLFPFNGRGPSLHKITEILAHALKLQYTTGNVSVTGSSAKARFYLDNSGYILSQGKPTIRNYIMEWNKHGY